MPNFIKCYVLQKYKATETIYILSLTVTDKVLFFKNVINF